MREHWLIRWGSIERWDDALDVLTAGSGRAGPRVTREPGVPPSEMYVSHRRT